MDMFNTSFHWMLIGQQNSTFNVLNILSTKNINVNSELTLATVKTKNPLEISLYDIW